MTYDAIADEVIALRFDETRRPSVKAWINAAYTKMWNLDDWYFKHVHGYALSVLQGSATPVLPSDFAAVEALYDANQNEICYLEPGDWRDYYENLTATGLANDYTVINRNIYIGPTPSQAYTLTLDYVRRVSYVNSLGNVTGGVMSADADEPIWDAEYDYVLVLEAAILGGSILGDLDVQSLIPARDDLLGGMRADLVRQTQGEEPKQVGAWPGTN